MGANQDLNNALNDLTNSHESKLQDLETEKKRLEDELDKAKQENENLTNSHESKLQDVEIAHNNLKNEHNELKEANQTLKNEKAQILDQNQRDIEAQKKENDEALKKLKIEMQTEIREAVKKHGKKVTNDKDNEKANELVQQKDAFENHHKRELEKATKKVEEDHKTLLTEQRAG